MRSARNTSTAFSLAALITAVIVPPALPSAAHAHLEQQTAICLLSNYHLQTDRFHFMAMVNAKTYVQGRSRSCAQAGCISNLRRKVILLRVGALRTMTFCQHCHLPHPSKTTGLLPSP